MRTALVAALMLLLDQLLKVLTVAHLEQCDAGPLAACERVEVLGFVNLVSTQNAGSALGFEQGLWVWPVLAGTGLLIIPIYARFLNPRYWAAPLAIGLQTGGALSNLLDRLTRDGGIDYLSIPPVPVVFNLADLALVLGALLACRLLLRGIDLIYKPPQHSEAKSETAKP